MRIGPAGSYTPPGSPSARAPRDTFRTPSPTRRLAEPSERLLREVGKPELVDLVLLLQNAFPARWAIGGSLAMKIHAHAQGEPQMRCREPNDVDLVVDPKVIPSLGARLRTETTLPDLQEHGYEQPPTLPLTPEVKVDILGELQRFGDPGQAVTVSGIPVMPLSSLVASKQNALADIQSERAMGFLAGDALTRHEALERKYQGDLEVLRHLQARADALRPPALD